MQGWARVDYVGWEVGHTGVQVVEGSYRDAVHHVGMQCIM